MGRSFRQLKWVDRIKIDALLKAKHSVAEIAKQLNVSRRTIYNELKRGRYLKRRSYDWKDIDCYSPDIAQRKYEENLKMRGTQLKIGNDMEYANYIESKIVDENYSPEAVLGELRVKGREKEFKTRICVSTLYHYIDKGIFLRLSNKDLPVKKYKKRGYKKIHRRARRASAGTSIELRPKEIDKREEFGHWEMDSVLGKRGKSKNTLLTLTERKTRNEIIFKLPDHTDESVVAALDRLERRWGAEMFRKVFKSITVDNGSEFANVEGIERSVITAGENRTKAYYCHPYCSSERGTNEVTNRFARRKVPKGSDIDVLSKNDVQKVEDWMNDYPRRIHGYHTAREKFEEELRKIG